MRHLSILAFTPLLLLPFGAACGGGGGGGGPTPALVTDFSGTWALTSRISASTCGAVGQIESTVFPIQQANGMVTIQDQDGDLTGVVSGSGVTLTRNDGVTSIALQMAAGNQAFAGAGMIQFDDGGTPCVEGIAVNAFQFVPMSTTASLYWNFEGHLVDLSGVGHHGSSRDGFDFVQASAGAGAGSMAGTFDGVDDRAVVDEGGGLVFDEGSAYSLSVWIRPTTTAGFGRQVIVAKAPPAGVTSAMHTPALFLSDGSFGAPGLVGFDMYFVAPIFTAQPVPMDQFSHVVVTYDGVSTHRIFLDGVLSNENSAMIGANENQNGEGPWVVTLGGSFNTTFPGGQFVGDVDELAFWPRELNAAEVAQLMLAGPAGI